MTLRYGAFGKVSALGDFLRIGFSPAVISAWDLWLANALVEARAVLGDRWDSCFGVAPIWRFTLPAGHLCPQALLGVMMPSVDRIGRQFPLMLGVALQSDVQDAEPGDLWRLHAAAEPCFDALEGVALSTLDDPCDRSGLADRLDSLPCLSLPERPVRHSMGGTMMAQAATTPGALTEIILHLSAAGQVGQGLAGLGIWSCLTQDNRRAFASAEMPRQALAAALFDLDAPYWGATAAERMLP